MAKIEITEEELSKYKEMKEKTESFWDKHKDKIFVGAIVVLAVENRRLWKFAKAGQRAHNNTVATYNANFESLDDFLGKMSDDIKLLKSIAVKTEK